jgi:condensin complex subunit 1
MISLLDSDFTVKKTTLNVLTHLVLNDMVKIKAELAEVGTLLSDPHEKVAQLAKLFFHELHKKDNKLIYNVLPESKLSPLYF